MSDGERSNDQKWFELRLLDYEQAHRVADRALGLFERLFILGATFNAIGILVLLNAALAHQIHFVGGAPANVAANKALGTSVAILFGGVIAAVIAAVLLASVSQRIASRAFQHVHEEVKAGEMIPVQMANLSALERLALFMVMLMTIACPAIVIAGALTGILPLLGPN